MILFAMLLSWVMAVTAHDGLVAVLPFVPQVLIMFSYDCEADPYMGMHTAWRAR
jgi:hypothetical protein